MTASQIKIGDVFGNWTVITGPFKIHYKTNITIGFRVRCGCGLATERDLPGSPLIYGKTKSCGCLRRGPGSNPSTTTHGGSKTRLYRIWKAMIRRCYLPTDSGFISYGGRGTKVCPEWIGGFVAFRDWAMSHGYTDTLTIDRIDGTGNYEPGNCRWATPREQANNLRTNRRLTMLGETKTMAEWGRDPRCAVSEACVKNRITRGWDAYEAFSRPPYYRLTDADKSITTYIATKEPTFCAFCNDKLSPSNKSGYCSKHAYKTPRGMEQSRVNARRYKQRKKEARIQAKIQSETALQPEKSMVKQATLFD